MNATTDFLALYRELGVPPECTPEEFKHAYRKRVSELHPDRAGGGEDALKLLNLGYAAAQEFHRIHGRFPGAATQRVVAHAKTATWRTTPAPWSPERADDTVDPRRRSRRVLLFLLAFLALVIVSHVLENDDHVADAPPPAVQSRSEPSTASVTPRHRLQVGMTRSEAVAIFGRPLELSSDGHQWLYGPSWIRVVCDQVVDWYSSPLKPLGTSRSRPGQGDVREDYQPREHCAASQGVPGSAAF